MDVTTSASRTKSVANQFGELVGRSILSLTPVGECPVSVTELEKPPHATPDMLQPVLGPRFALGWIETLACGWFALFFLYLNYIPLFHSDLWGHVLFGSWILEHGRLPAEDPFLAVAEGMRVIDNAWLGQVLLAAADAVGGPHMLSNLFAVTVFASYFIQTRTFYLMSGNLPLSLLGMAFSFFMGFSRHAIIRPEIFGVLCFSIMLWMIVRITPWRERTQAFADAASRSVPGWLWVGLPVLFVAWANLHGSFAVGLLILALHAIARIIEVACRQRSLIAILQDPSAQTWVILTELCLAATLINPYGIDLLFATASFGSNTNLQDVMEWFPLKLIALEGIQFCIGVVTLIILFRHSRQRVSLVDALMLLVLTATTAKAIRMIGWFAPVLAFTLMPHMSELWNRYVPATWFGFSERARFAADGKPRFMLSLAALLCIWVGFALSPISQVVLGGKTRRDDQLYSRFTPLELSAHLRENPLQGLVFAPQWWGDWLIWSTDQKLDVFMTTNVHLVPRIAWRDYMRVAEGHSEWESTLDRYNTKWLVVHKELQERLAQLARRSRVWSVVYEDEKSLLLKRSEPS